MDKRRAMLTAMGFLAGGVLVCVAAIFAGMVMDQKNEEQYTGFIQTEPITEAVEEEQETPPPFVVDWAAVCSTNSEVAGWIYVDADNAADIISYPVLYRAGDREYYLRHDISGAYSKYGVPYIPGDYDLNAPVLSIHGHNFGESANVMFSPLVKYEDEEYARRHPIVWYACNGEEARAYQIFSVMRYDCTDMDAGAPCWNYLQTEFVDNNELTEWLAHASSESLFPIGETPRVGAKVIVLSTCQTATRTPLRCVVFASEVITDETR